MSDIGETYAAIKRRNKFKKLKNRNQSTNILVDKNINFDSFNGGVHLVIKHDDQIADYWPSTGKFIFRNADIKGRGVYKLLKKLGVAK